MASDQLVASTQLCLHRKLRNHRTQSKSINIRKANSISWLKISYIYRPDMSRAQVKGPRDEICLKRPRLSRAKDLKTNALLYLYILILFIASDANNCDSGVAFLSSLFISAGVCPDGGLLSPRLRRPRTCKACV